MNFDQYAKISNRNIHVGSQAAANKKMETLGKMPNDAIVINLNSFIGKGGFFAKIQKGIEVKRVQYYENSVFFEGKASFGAKTITFIKVNDIEDQAFNGGKPSPSFEKLFALAKHLMKNYEMKNNTPIYINCYGGISRSLTLGILMDLSLLAIEKGEPLKKEEVKK